MTPTESAPPGWQGPKSDKQFLGHPVGLFILFFTEMWERFSYYGMRGLLKLYMVNYLFITIRQSLQGGKFDGTGSAENVIGWGFVKSLLPKVDITNADIIKQCIEPTVKRMTEGEGAVALEAAQKIAEQTCSVAPNASFLYGTYTALVYLTPLLGGYFADKFLGQKKAVFIGGTIMALGQFVLFGMESMFFIGLTLLIIGNGFFKPNISTQVGNLYPPGDARRDGAFTIFYMGINLGAFACNIVCGTLAALYGWRYGFLAAGIGMCVGLVVQLLGQSFLAPDTLQARGHADGGKPVEHAPFTKDERSRIWALVILCALNVVFWAVYEQQGNTMQSWADEQTVWPAIPTLFVGAIGGLGIGALLTAIVAFVAVAAGFVGDMSNSKVGRIVAIGAGVGALIGLGWAFTQESGSFQIPSTWFQSANPFFIFLLAPFFDVFWRWQNKKGSEPSSVAKMAIGCFVLGLSFIVMIVGARVVGDGKGTWFWPIFCTLLLTVGELYLSPIGLSLVTKVSPVRIVSLMMGMWFLSSFFGNFLSGWIGSYYTTMSKDSFFLLLLVLGCAAGAAIWLFNRRLKAAMGSHAS